MVVPDPAVLKDFRYHIKQRGGMLAKGRLLGLQFDTLFTDDLYTRINARAVEQAQLIRAALNARGVSMLIDSPTNQQFPILTAEQREYLTREFVLTHWTHLSDGRDAMRICTGWATRDEAVERLLEAIRTMPEA